VASARGGCEQAEGPGLPDGLDPAARAQGRWAGTAGLHLSQAAAYGGGSSFGLLYLFAVLVLADRSQRHPDRAGQPMHAAVPSTCLMERLWDGR
jgi:hypothetical protein